MSMSPAQRGRIGGYTNSAQNGARNASRARAGLLEKFADKVDPEHRLTDAERQVRARAALRAHLTRISAAGVSARQAKRARSLAQERRAS